MKQNKRKWAETKQKKMKIQTKNIYASNYLYVRSIHLYHLITIYVCFSMYA